MLPLRIAGSFLEEGADSWECKLVCFIIDANMANKFAPSPDDDVKPVILRLTDPRYESRVANGGKYGADAEQGHVRRFPGSCAN